MATDAFGLSDTPPEIALGLVDEVVEEHETLGEASPEPTVEDKVEEAEAPAVEQAEETPSEPEVQEQELEPEAPEVEEEQEAPVVEAEEAPAEEEPPRLWAGKYNSPDELEKGYNESREMWRRAQEAKKAVEQQAYEASLREAELANIISEAIPYLRQAAEREQNVRVWAEQYRQNFGEYPQGYAPAPQGQEKPLGPTDVNSLVEQRLAQERAQMQAQMERDREVQAVEQAVNSFYSDHPEVEPRSPADNEITDAMQVLNEAWSARDEEIDMADRGSIEVLYEASKRPALLEVFALKPEYFDSERGLRLARMEAAYLEGAPPPEATQETRTVPASQVGKTAGQRKPFAESAVSGAEAEEQSDENDPWTQIVAEHRKTQNKAKASVWQFE